MAGMLLACMKKIKGDTRPFTQEQGRQHNSHGQLHTYDANLDGTDSFKDHRNLEDSH